MRQATIWATITTGIITALAADRRTDNDTYGNLHIQRYSPVQDTQ